MPGLQRMAHFMKEILRPLCDCVISVYLIIQVCVLKKIKISIIHEFVLFVLEVVRQKRAK